MRIFIFMATVLCLFSLTGFEKKDRLTDFSWETMVSIKGYGNINPEEKFSSGYVTGNVEILKAAFANLVHSRGSMPAGAARYATVTFSQGFTVQLVMTTAKPLAFKVMRDKYGDNSWFEATKPLTWEQSHEIKRLQAYRG